MASGFFVAFNSSIINFDRPSEPSIEIGRTKISVEVVKDNGAVQKGLSGRDSLDSNGGMLFIFDKPDIYRFWMPDMRFSIDILWLGADKKVVGITRNLPPETNMAKPKFYVSPKSAQYVLEVNAGFAAKKNVQIGDKAVFKGVELQ